MIGINIRGLDTATERLRGLLTSLRMDVPNKEASILLHRWVNENFQSAGGKVGGWKSFKPVRVKGAMLEGRWTGRGNTRRFDTSARLELDTGQLRQSFHPFFDTLRAGIRSQLAYAEPQHRGVPSRNLPARPLLPRPGDVLNALRRVYRAWLTRMTK